MSKRWVRRLVKGSVGAGLALVVLCTGFVACGRRRLGAALERIEAAGQPVEIGDVEFGRLEGEDPGALLDELATLESSPYSMSDIMLEALLGREEAGPLGPSMEPLIAEFERCLAASEQDIPSFRRAYWENVLRGTPLTECQLAALKAATFVDPEELAVVRSARAYGGVDWNGWLAEFADSDEVMPTSEWTRGTIAGVRLLGNLALIAATEQRTEDAVELLDELVHLVRVHSSAPCYLEYEGGGVPSA